MSPAVSLACDMASPSLNPQALANGATSTAGNTATIVEFEPNVQLVFKSTSFTFVT